VADQPTNSLPIFTGDKSLICSSSTFIDGNGDTQVGTKACGGAAVDNCAADGIIGCVTTATYKSADLTNLSAGNIMSGVTIAGVSGTYIGVAPDPWDVRVGTTVNGVTGKLKVNCRNRVGSNFNYDGAIGSIGNSGVSSGTAIDIWDTIDDYNNSDSGLPPSVVTAWGNNTDCGGVEATAGDDNVWKDVTTAGTGAASCSGSPERCTMQDKITGLSWSKLQASAVWDTAWSNCQSLNYNGQTGWRLPTQKELWEAYTHGIRSIPSSYAAANTNWMTEANMDAWFWSGSSGSTNSANAWFMHLAYGATYDVFGKASPYPLQVVCVR
jgi:hypothetical protein